MPRIVRFLQALASRRRAERDMDDEWRFHIDTRVEDLARRGVSRTDAERQARREFGDPLRWKERAREVRGLRPLDELRQDLAYAVRQMARAPGFTLVAVLTLGLGIGANTAIFSIVNAVLLRPLPYPDADRLVRVWSTMATAGEPRSPSSMPDYREWRDRNEVFAALGAYFTAACNLTGRERPERLRGAYVTSTIWRVLDVQPALGRIFGAEADEWGNHREAILSDALWQRRFGGDPAIIGASLRLDDEPYTIVGVMPSSFQFPDASADLWMPIAFAPDASMNTRNMHFVGVLGRLRRNVTIAQAQADLSVIAEQISREVKENDGLGVALVRWHDAIVGDVRATLWLLLGAVGLVVLIACANVANLLIARASARRVELGIRAALGAGRHRLLRQLMTESVVLAGLGATVGAAIAFVLLRTLPALGASSIPRLGEVSLDATVLVFTGGLTLATVLVFGLWPAWQVSTVDVNESVRESSRGATSGRASLRLRELLIIAEVSCSLVLLVAAGLLLLSLVRVQQVDPGFRADHLLTMHVTLPASRYQTPQRRAFVDQTLERIAALPGVLAAGVTSALPLSQGEWTKQVTVEGQPIPASLADVPVANYRQVTPDYFAALRTTLRRGRLFTADDRAQRPYVAIVNEVAARRLWPGVNPVGTRMRLGPPEALLAGTIEGKFPGGLEAWRRQFPWVTIVGIVADMRQNGLEREANAEVFVPYSQGGGDSALSSFYFAVQAASDPMRLSEAVQGAVHSVDPQQPLADIQPMEARLADSLARRRFTMLLIGAFGATALLLALVGLYGVMAYAVNQRRAEMGIRTALGARPRDLLGLIVGQGMRLAIAGVAVGLVLAAALSRLLSSQLFGVAAIDPGMYASAALLLLACAGLACWLPSRRAMRVDPLTTLREG